MPIVTSIAGNILDDVYLVEVPSPPTIQGVQVGIVGMVGTFLQGIPTAIYSISDYPTAVRLLGASSDVVAGPIALQNLLRQRSGDIKVVPAFGSGAAGASVNLYDNSQATPVLFGTLVAAQPHPQTGEMTPIVGSGPNAWSVSVVQPVTPNGTFDLTITAGSVVEAYNNMTQDIWASQVTYRSTIAKVTFEAPYDPTPVQGTMRGTWTSTFADNGPDQMINLPSSPSGKSNFSVDAGQAHFVSPSDWTINGDQITRTPSGNIPSHGNVTISYDYPGVVTPSMSTPSPGAYYFSGGSTGISQFDPLQQTSQMDSALIGATDGSGNASGLALLATLSPGTINLAFVAEYTSSPVTAALAAYANANNAIVALCTAKNSTTAQTITARAAVSQDNVAFVDGWTTCYDADLDANRVCAPTALVLGMASQLPPQYSWGNRTIYGTQGLVTARSSADMAQMQKSGVLCLANSIPRGGFGTRSGVASDGSDLYVRRMRYFLEFSIIGNMGWAVDALQSTSATDPLRRDVTQSISTFLNGLADPVDQTLKVIDAFLVVCNSTNNPPAQVAAGRLAVSVTVRLLAAAKQIVISANISTSAVTTSSALQ